MRKRSRQSGFVMLMTLVLLLMAVVALAGIAHNSLNEALQTRSDLRELKRRWAVTSLRMTFLGRVESLLDEAERRRNKKGEPAENRLSRPRARISIECRLADIDYEIVFTDEQAKLNVNKLLETDGRGEAQSAIRRLVDSSGVTYGRGTKVNLRTRTGSDNYSKRGRKLPEVGGYGQIFQNVPPGLLVGRKRHPGLVSNITCWGDGKVNLCRAPAAVVKQICEDKLDERVVSALLVERQRDPYRQLEAMLTKIDDVNENQRKKIRQCLTDRSGCHGMWVIAHDKQRAWYTLAVGVSSAPADSREENGGYRIIEQWYEFSW